MEAKEFLSSEAESTFTTTIEMLSFSISISIIVKSRLEHTYICTTQHSYIPLASCHLPKDQLQLSNVALQELKRMAQLLSHTPEPDTLNMLKSRGEHFFQRFGSHVNQGPLHFAGIIWWKVKKQTSDALSSYAWGSNSSFDGSIAAGISVGKSAQREIQLFVTKTGGPPGMDSLTAWKATSLASNKTWAVIERGSQLIPVWDIIMANHRQDFKDVYQMNSILIRAYETLTYISENPLIGEELASAVEEARLFLEEMKSWEITGDEEQLVTLLRFKQKLNEKTKHIMWINICLSDKVLQDFLENSFTV
uniref:Uncharacterized protein n=1 Tax=Pelusios castaneus TaxID=367368 RepID=A0A8C8S9I1_9SAUR